MKRLEILVVWLFIAVFLAILFYVAKPAKLKDCPLTNGHNHVWSEYRTDGTVICAYQEVMPGKTVLRKEM